MAETQTLASAPNPRDPSMRKASPSPTALETTSASDLPDLRGPRKRRRSSRPTPMRDTKPAPGSASSKTLLSPSPSPRALTGAAALADGQQQQGQEGSDSLRSTTSPNSAQEALHILSAASNAEMSRLNDTTKAVTPPGLGTTQTTGEAHMSRDHSREAHSEQASPRTSPLTTHRQSLPVSSSNGEMSTEPHHMGRVDDEALERGSSPRLAERSRSGDGGSLVDETQSHKSHTFPGPLGLHPHRTASLPNSGYKRDQLSSSSKRHKCPYCNTDFTRHHNLKSHLLTHSQEKPFSCDRCDSRFRRLHDLKRHAKLHTGERPHVCPKCERSFARGDALARHNKGQGGCAGRRESIGSFAGDDRHEEPLRSNTDTDTMAGILYTNEASHEPEHLDDDNDGPLDRDLPRIAKHDAPLEAQSQSTDQQSLYHARQPNTYPPVAARPAAAGQLYPPPPLTSPRLLNTASTSQSSTNHYPPPASGSSAFQTPNSNVFTQPGGMTESPKPLSPGGVNAHQLGHGDPGLQRHRSPSLSQSLPQAHYRRTTGHNTSPPVSLPPPHTGTNLPHAPHLPPLQGLNPPESRFTLHSHSAGSLPGPPSAASVPGYQPGHTSSGSSHGTGRHGSLEMPGLQAAEIERLWTQVNLMNSKIQRLEEEVTNLRAHNGGIQNR